MDDLFPARFHVIKIAVATAIGCIASVWFAAMLAFYSSPSVSIERTVTPGRWTDTYINADIGVHLYRDEVSSSLGYRIELLLLSDSDVYHAYGSTQSFIAVRVFAGWPLKSFQGESYYGDHASGVIDPDTVIYGDNLQFDILSPLNTFIPSQIIPVPFMLNMLAFSISSNLLFCRGSWREITKRKRGRE